MKKSINTVAVMTSGGDVPGLNAAIRAVVRTAVVRGLTVIAINRGYEGMIEGDFKELSAESVSNIIQLGGTIIKTSRSERFMKKKWRAVACDQLTKAGIDGVIVIGGNGSFSGANVFTSEFKVPFIGVPKTIDNDVYGTDFSIGFDTATNTALEAIDKIRDTADAYNRLFFVEVMGRDLGFIALHCGIGAGAEVILVPEVKTNITALISKLEKRWEKHKSSIIVVVAEGAVEGGVMEIVRKVKTGLHGYDIRMSVLGHIQRGGSPSCFDRVLATRLGYEAVNALLKGKKNVVVGMKNYRLVYTPFIKASSVKHSIDRKWLIMADELSS